LVTRTRFEPTTFGFKYGDITRYTGRIKEEWHRVGPANKRCYDALPMPEKALLKPASVDLVRSCINFLSSGDRCYGFLNIFAEKIGDFVSKESQILTKVDHNIGFMELTPRKASIVFRRVLPRAVQHDRPAAASAGREARV
jgi:hypothetical protein